MEILERGRERGEHKKKKSKADFPGDRVDKESAHQCKEHGFDP